MASCNRLPHTPGHTQLQQTATHVGSHAAATDCHTRRVTHSCNRLPPKLGHTQLQQTATHAGSHTAATDCHTRWVTRSCSRLPHTPGQTQVAINCRTRRVIRSCNKMSHTPGHTQLQQTATHVGSHAVQRIATHVAKHPNINNNNTITCCGRSCANSTTQLTPHAERERRRVGKTGRVSSVR